MTVGLGQQQMKSSNRPFHCRFHTRGYKQRKLQAEEVVFSTETLNNGSRQMTNAASLQMRRVYTTSNCQDHRMVCYITELPPTRRWLTNKRYRIPSSTSLRHEKLRARRRPLPHQNQAVPVDYNLPERHSVDGGNRRRMCAGPCSPP